MTTELKPYGGSYFPKIGVLKKNPDLKPFAIAVKAASRAIAEAAIFVKFASEFPQLIDDYFKVKVWEDRPGLPRPAFDVFSNDFYNDTVIWNAKTGEPESVQAESGNAETNEQSPGNPADKMTTVRSLSANYRAGSLVLFGAVEEITASQYSQIIDLINSDEASFLREQAEAVSRDRRVMALSSERQVELLAHVRQKSKPTAQWTDIAKIITAWLDTPPHKRESTTDGTASAGAKPGRTINELQQAAVQMRRYVALGVLARSMDFDIHCPPVGIELRVNSLMSDKNDAEVSDWVVCITRTPGWANFDAAAIVAMIKTRGEKFHIYPGQVREYIDTCIASFDFVTPPPLVIDIACGRSSSPLPLIKNIPGENKQESWAESGNDEINADTDRALTATAENDNSADDTPEPPASNAGATENIPDAAVEDVREPVSNREIEIAHALNDLMSGRTNIMSSDDVTGVLACTGHLVSHVLPLLLDDIVVTEYCLSPDFTDEEIHDVATSVLDSWDESEHVRRKIAMDAIVEYRKPVPPKPVVIEPPVITVKPRSEQPQQPAAPAAGGLTYQQQLTLAALQGMCANPAYRADYNDLPQMAVMLAVCVINAECE